MTISQKLANIATIKENIRQAIVDNGVSVDADEPLSNYSTKIGNISTIPSGTIHADANGTYDVTKYASCVSEGSKLVIPREITNNIYQHRSSNFTCYLPNNVAGISNSALANAFYGCTGLTSIDLSNITTLEPYALYYAFYGCTGLTSIDLSGIISIQHKGYALGYTFSSCTELTSVDLSSLENGSLEYTFYNCSKLTNVDLSSFESGFLCYTFSNCSRLASIDLSSMVSGGLVSTFQYCTSLTSVDLSSLVTLDKGPNNDDSPDYSAQNAFYGCTSLASINFPALKKVNASNVFYNAFQGCTNLTQVGFPNLEELSGASCMNQTFYNCTSLKSISFPKLKIFGTHINQFSNAFKNCTNINIHFRFDVQSVIESMTGYSTTAPFGASSGTVLFDLSRAELAFNITSGSAVSIYIDGELQS